MKLQIPLIEEAKHHWAYELQLILTNLTKLTIVGHTTTQHILSIFSQLTATHQIPVREKRRHWPVSDLVLRSRFRSNPSWLHVSVAGQAWMLELDSTIRLFNNLPTFAHEIRCVYTI